MKLLAQCAGEEEEQSL